MSSKFRGSRDMDKLEKTRRRQDICSPPTKRAALILKEEAKKKIKDEVSPEREKRIKELGIGPGKKFKLHGRVVTVEKIEENSLVKIVGCGGKFSPKYFEPIKS